MNAIPHINQAAPPTEAPFRARTPLLWKLLVPIGCLLLLVAEPTRSLTLQILADAYWQVGAFVAGTLWLFYFIQDRLDNLGHLTSPLMKSRASQVLFAAFMGVLPGCGGAIIVMTQFVKGQVRFGALVAVLTSTMGDAAILLIGAKPSAAMIVLPIALVTGTVAGLCVDLLHGDGFMRPSTTPPPAHTDSSCSSAPAETHFSGKLWKIILLPTTVIALLIAFQYNAEAIFWLPEGSLTIIGAVIALAVIVSWALQSAPRHADGSACARSESTPLLQRVADDTNFVLCCVVAGFMTFELIQMAAPIPLTELPSQASHFLILGAIMVGWIPGCGPQILTTTLFINGAIPMSAQLGNALSNDGDALFPALALAPRAALVATAYSTIPAIMVAYGYAFLFE